MAASNQKHVPLSKLALSYSSVLMLPFLGSSFVKRRFLAPQIRDSKRISDAVKAYESYFNDDEEAGSEEAPVFIFSAGWGCGSTLLQRLLISSEKLIVWGEPMDEAAPLHRMAELIAPIREHWPPVEHFRSTRSAAELSGEWIANYSPDLSNYKAAHQGFFLQWLSSPEYFDRWGLKEVRLTIDHANYLKWLFPNAKFLFIYRDVYDSYLSVRRRPWTSVWPNYPATNIVSFAHHWRHLLQGFVNQSHEVDGMLIKFEDLVSGELDTNSIADYLELPWVDSSVLEKKVGSRSKRRKPLHKVEKLIIDAVAGELRKQLGYR